MSTMTLTHPTRIATRAVAARTTAACRPAGVRLTRRGRLTVFVLALLVALAIGVFVAAGSVATEEPGVPQPTEVIMVGTGDTLWGIASELTEGGDVRSMMNEISRLNALDSGMLAAGQRLRVPVE